MWSARLAATAKHFPGLGAAPESTDVEVQRIRLSRARLRRIDERPYRAFTAREGDVVMLSTAIYPRFSAKPAAFSRRLATAELRSRIGFRGVSISDALETVSARGYGGPAKVALAAARAGTDLLLFTDHRAAATAGRSLSRSLRSGELARSPFLRSVRRVLALRARTGAG
jgi:beta-N-acetylhexosaminidase